MIMLVQCEPRNPHVFYELFIYCAELKNKYTNELLLYFWSISIFFAEFDEKKSVLIQFPGQLKMSLARRFYIYGV